MPTTSVEADPQSNLPKQNARLRFLKQDPRQKLFHTDASVRQSVDRQQGCLEEAQIGDRQLLMPCLSDPRAYLVQARPFLEEVSGRVEILDERFHVRHMQIDVVR